MSERKIKKIEAAGFKTRGQEHVKVTFEDGNEEVYEMWDYKRIYHEPHLYKALYCDFLGYNLYEVFWNIFKTHFSFEQPLKVLDVGCGSGLMGKYIRDNSEVDVDYIYGIDALPEALIAVKRDNKGVYDQLLSLSAITNKLHQNQFNCITMSGVAHHLTVQEYGFYKDILSSNGYMMFNAVLDTENEKRKRILNYLNKELTFVGSKVFELRKLVNGEVIKQEAFLYRKD